MFRCTWISHKGFFFSLFFLNMKFGSNQSKPEFTVDLKGAMIEMASKDKSSKKNVFEVINFFLSIIHILDCSDWIFFFLVTLKMAFSIIESVCIKKNSWYEDLGFICINYRISHILRTFVPQILPFPSNTKKGMISFIWNTVLKNTFHFIIKNPCTVMYDSASFIAAYQLPHSLAAYKESHCLICLVLSWVILLIFHESSVTQWLDPGVVEFTCLVLVPAVC